MADVPRDAWIDELERDLGQGAALRLLAAAGGQQRFVPRQAIGSKLSNELPLDVVEWLSRRFGGTEIDVPSVRAREQRDSGARLRAAILDAGLTEPRRTANAIAAEFGVTTKWVRSVRTELREEYGIQPLFPGFLDDL